MRHLKHPARKKKKGTDINTKVIAHDKITSDFLRNLRPIRKSLGFTQDFVANAVGITRSTFIYIEKGLVAPSLEILIKLAKFLKIDISASINAKFFYKKIDTATIKKAIRSYGLSYAELSQITGYSPERISLSVRLKPDASIRCLYAVLQVIHKERLVRSVVDSLTHSKGGARFTDTEI